MSISHDDRYVFSGSVDKSLKQWELATGQCINTFEGHLATVSCVRISGDGRWAISAGSDTTLRLWDLSSKQCVRTFEDKSNFFVSASISDDGALAFTASLDNTLRFWKLQGSGSRAHQAYAFPRSAIDVSTTCCRPRTGECASMSPVRLRAVSP